MELKSPEEIRGYLYRKVDEWLTDMEYLSFDKAQEAEQAFKEWLWGTSHG